MNVTVSKTNTAVLGLCKLHNFCIQSTNCGDDIVSSDFRDASNINREGGLVLPRIDRDDGSENRWRYEAEDRLDSLLDGGQHMDDHSDVGDTVTVMSYQGSQFMITLLRMSSVDLTEEQLDRTVR